MTNKKQLSIQEISLALQQSWNAQTGYAGVGIWTRDNPARGQCVTSSLVVQDYLGGDIVRYAVNGDSIDETHYFNVLDDGTTIDTTGHQYTVPVVMTPKPIVLNDFSSARAKLLADKETSYRYGLLKMRVEQLLENGRL